MAITHNMMEQASPAPVTAPIPDVTDNPQDTRRRPIPAITHFAVLTAFIAPIALLPYLVTRRQLTLLHRKVEEMGVTAAALQRDARGTMSQIAITKEEHHRTKALLHDMMGELEELRLQAEQRESARKNVDDAIRNDLRRLLDESQQMRAQTAVLRPLGTSLADVAAFMHEVELERGFRTLGKDRRGIERLRQLALRMQTLSQESNSGETPLTRMHHEVRDGDNQ